MINFISQLSLKLADIDLKAYRDKKKQQDLAVIKIKTLLKPSIEYILKILNNPGIYQYKDYYPNSNPETSASDAKCFSERPSRLIFNEKEKLKKSLAEPLIIIPKEQAEKLFELLIRFDLIIAQINGYLQLLLGDHPQKSEFKNYNPEDLEEDLKNILDEAQSILDPSLKR